MSVFKPSEKSPLSALIELLKEDFRFDGKVGVISQIDTFQKKEDSYVKYIYDSSIFYLARRLVILASYAMQQSDGGNYQVIERAIEEVFDLSCVENSELLIMILIECYKESEKKLSTGNKNRTVLKSKDEGGGESYCYICGETLNYNEKNSSAYCEAEHILPRSLGGGNYDYNLKGACKRCNGFKGDRIGGADIHVHSMVYPFFDEGKNKISDYHIFAARFFNGSTCSFCGLSADKTGALSVTPKENNDVWHLFNTSLLCPVCLLNSGDAKN